MPCRLPLTLCLLALLAACTSPLGNGAPSPLPVDFLPTAIAQTQTALATDSPPLPTPASETPLPKASATRRPALSRTPTVPPSLSTTPTLTATLTPTPTPTFTATPVAIPDAAIQIQAPGPMSKVLSPIRLRGYVLPGYRNQVRIELFGEDGRLLARRLTYVYTALRWAYLSVNISFEISAAAEVARLQVSTEDEFGRTSALSSVRLLLLSSGYEDINPPGNMSERCVLNTPRPGDVLAGSILRVDGKIRPLNDQPLIIELITRDGQIVATRLVTVLPAADDGYVPFQVDIPFLVEGLLPVRLSIRQNDDRIGGTMYLYSQEISISP